MAEIRVCDICVEMLIMGLFYNEIITVKNNLYHVSAKTVYQSCTIPSLIIFPSIDFSELLSNVNVILPISQMKHVFKSVVSNKAHEPSLNNHSGRRTYW